MLENCIVSDDLRTKPLPFPIHALSVGCFHLATTGDFAVPCDGILQLTTL